MRNALEATKYQKVLSHADEENILTSGTQRGGVEAANLADKQATGRN
jgi:hypothetical protein